MKEEIRDSFVKTLQEIKKQNEQVVILVSDSSSTCRIKPFFDEYPESVINIGIAEQNMVGIAAGMSMGGFIPVTANATPFLMGRSNEQVKNDVCYSQTNVKLVGLNPGFAYGSLGPTHHCLDDISTMLAFGGIEILAPSDPEETKQITQYAIAKKGPVYIRLDSFVAENIHKENYTFKPGNTVIIREGSDITLIALGTMVHEVIAANEELEKQGISAEIISIPSIRPLDPEGIIKSLKKTGAAITFEEHSTHGGIGSIIGDIILKNQLNCKIKKLGVPAGQFAEASPRSDIKESYNLHKEGIIHNVLALLDRR